jgi:pimeloyl-ACP methyl ester carboxylesterase
MLVGLKWMVNMDLHFFKWMPRSNSEHSKNALTMLVFLHGMGGTGQIWRPIAASLEEDFLCIAPDQRGHGQSRPIPDSESNLFHASDYARDLVSMLEKLVAEHSPSRIFIIGHSMGVRSGLATAVSILAEHPVLKPLFKGFISVDIGLQSKWGGGIGEPLANFIRDLPETFPNRNTLKDYCIANCPDPAIAQYLTAVAKKTNDTPETWMFPFNHEALVQTILQADEAPIESWVKTICEAGIPFLALRGSNSKVWLKEDYENSRIKLANPLLTFEEWPDCGHGLPFEQRPKFISRVREFVQSV